MNLTIRRSVATVIAISAVPFLGALSPAQALAGEDYFVVNTTGKQSSIVDAGGAFASCTTVRDKWGTAEQLSPQRLRFEGEKVVSCDGGKVTIFYSVTTASGQVTIGEWYVTGSTLEGAISGGGAVHGDSSECEPVRPGGFCILDTFSGDVS